MRDHFRATNLEWQPAVVLWDAINALGRPSTTRIRDPTKRSHVWSDRAKLFRQLVLLNLYHALGVLGAPVARVIAFAVWIGNLVSVFADVGKKVLLSVVGWGHQRVKQPRPHVEYSMLIDVRRWHLILGVLLCGGILWRTVAAAWALCNHTARRSRHVLSKMANATSFTEWLSLARDLEAIRSASKDGSSSGEDDGLYDKTLLISKAAELSALKNSGRLEPLMLSLRADLYRNFGNITNKDLYENRHTLPWPIKNYISTVQRCLDFIVESDQGITPEAKLSFFQETRHAFGRTALVLSGGGALGAFHLGVVRGLLEQGHLPRIIAGSSVGSIVAAIAAVHTDDELRHMYDNMDTFNLSFFGNNNLVAAVKHLAKNGTLQDITFLVKRLRALLADVTFLEAYERTGRILNVTVTAADTNEPPRMLNYLTAPNAVVWSAVAASSAFPGLFPAQELLAKSSDGRFVKYAAPWKRGAKRRWHDGSLENDLPFRQLSELFNVNHFVVSQTNPHLVPLVTLRKVMNTSLFNLMEAEVKHAFLQAQLYLPRWIPTKWTRLFTQPWSGDVTIVIPWSLYARSISKAIHNPTSSELVIADRLGRRSTWEKMCAVEGNCAVEKKLDSCLLRLLASRDAQADAAVSAGQRHSASGPVQSSTSRIPSWAQLSAQMSSFPINAVGGSSPTSQDGTHSPSRGSPSHPRIIPPPAVRERNGTGARSGAGEAALCGADVPGALSQEPQPRLPPPPSWVCAKRASDSAKEAALAGHAKAAFDAVGSASTSSGDTGDESPAAHRDGFGASVGSAPRSGAPDSQPAASGLALPTARSFQEIREAMSPPARAQRPASADLSPSAVTAGAAEVPNDAVTVPLDHTRAAIARAAQEGASRRGGWSLFLNECVDESASIWPTVLTLSDPTVNPRSARVPSSVSLDVIAP